MNNAIAALVFIFNMYANLRCDLRTLREKFDT